MLLTANKGSTATATQPTTLAGNAAVTHPPLSASAAAPTRMVPGLDLKLKAGSGSGKATIAHQENLLPRESNTEPSSSVMRTTDENETSSSDIAETEQRNVRDVTVEVSSSFGGTDSEAEDGPEQTSAPDFGEYYDMFRTRNKKLTPHWRRFIRPLMWRCKWMELRMNELQSQVVKYDTELAVYDEIKSLPFSSQSQRDKLMKRRKRTRVEERDDIGPYMSQHSFFSYYETKKPVSDDDSAEDNLKSKGTKPKKEVVTKEGFSLDPGFSLESGFSLKSRDEDGVIEAIFRNIETVQSRIRKLITRLDTVVYVNAEKTSMRNKLGNVGLPQNVPGNSALNPGNRNGLKVETSCISSKRSFEKNMGDLLMLDGVVSSHGELSRLSLVGDLFANTNEEVLIDNEQAKKELHDFEKFREQFGEKPLVSEELIEITAPVSEANYSIPSKANAHAQTESKKRKRKSVPGK